MNRKRLGMCIFPQIALFEKKASIKSDQHHIAVQKSRVISGLSVITWSRYIRGIQSDDYVVIVNQWHPCKFQGLVTTAIFRVII